MNVTSSIFFAIFFVAITINGAACGRFDYWRSSHQNSLRGPFGDFDYLPKNIILAGYGSAPKLTPTFKMMRSAFDMLSPILRHAGPRPVPTAAELELGGTDIAPSPVIQARVIPSAALKANVISDVPVPLANITHRYPYIPLSTDPSPYESYFVDHPAQIHSCQLARWEYEIPLTYIPNIIFRFLATKDVCADNSCDKNDRTETRRNLSDILTLAMISAGSDYSFAKESNMSNYFNLSLDDAANVFRDDCDQTLTFSLQMLIRSALYIHNFTSGAEDNTDLLTAVIESAQNCMSCNPMPAKLIPCLDFSLHPEDLLRLNKSTSIFGSYELCNTKFVPSITSCLAKDDRPLAVLPETIASDCYCSAKDLVTLSIFARSYFLCQQVFPRQPFDELGDFGV